MQAIEYSLTEALAALAAGKKKVAQVILTSIIKEDARNALAWLYLAVTLPRDGAIQALRRVLILDPENAVAGRNLERLRRTDMELEFTDLYPEPKITPYFEATPQLFDLEPPTINLREIQQAAEFGDETGTIPYAFSFLARAVEESVYRPNVNVTLADLFSKKEMELFQINSSMPQNIPVHPALPPVAPPPPPKTIPPAALDFNRSPFPVAPMPLAVAGPPKPVIKEQSLVRPTAALPQPTFRAVPRAIPETLTRPLPGMPRLEERPRYMLGTTPRPMFGFTGFGIIILVAFCLALIFAALWMLPI